MMEDDTFTLAFLLLLLDGINLIRGSLSVDMVLGKWEDGEIGTENKG